MCLSGLNRRVCLVKGCQMLSYFCNANLPTGINKVTLKEGRTADHVHDAHFISYTRLVLGLVHIDMVASHSCCRFIDCTSMMRLTQRFCIGLRSGDSDCGVWAQWARWHVQETSVLWHGVLSLSSCQKILPCGRKWMEMVSSNTQVLLRTPKCAVKTSPTPSHLCHQPELLIWSSFLFVCCWPYHLNVAVEIETQQIR